MASQARETRNQIEQLKRLNKERSAAGDVRGVLRCKALLAYYKGEERETILACFGIGRKTFKQWLRRFEEEGSVCDRPHAGRPTKLPEEKAAELKALMVSQQGRVWTARHVHVLLLTLFQVSYAVKYLPQRLRQLGLSFHKAVHELVRKDSQQRTRWIQTTLPALYAEALQAGWRIFFQDEVGFQTEGTLAYTWGVKGEKIPIPNYGRHGRVNLIGAWELGTGQFYGVLTSFKVNACRFRRFLCHLKHEMRQDKFILICDNPRFHKAKWLTAWLTQQAWLRLEFLPAYSPDFNPIERLWHWIKTEYTHNPCWDTQAALAQHLRHMLTQLPQQTTEILGLMRQEILRLQEVFDFYETPFPLSLNPLTFTLGINFSG